jgi:adenosylhomocysteine nucleosidase
MKTIGIIGAMENEIALLLDEMQNMQMIEKASMKFYKGEIAGKSAVVVRSGIGKVNAAVCAQILVDNFGAEAIINTGIAGSLNNDINIGDLVLSTDVVHHDMDAAGFGYPVGQIPQMQEFSFPADKKLRELAKAVCAERNLEANVFEGRIVSGDQFISSREVKERIIQNVGGYAVEMEGAAIGQAAYLNGIPFLIVRCISDKADDSAELDYPAFEKFAVKIGAKLTLGMIAKL